MIVVTLREPDVASARRQLAMIGAAAAQVEIRLDDLAGQEWAGLIAGSRLPVIATCRPIHLGGGFSGSEDERVAMLRDAAAAGAALIDVELGSTAEALCKELPAGRVLVSHHDFEIGSGGVDAAFTQDPRLLARGVLRRLAEITGFEPVRVQQNLHRTAVTGLWISDIDPLALKVTP